MKNMRRIYSSLAVSMGLVFAVTAISPSSVLAATEPTNIPTYPTSSSGLSITPRRNAILQPGQTLKDELVIGNLNPVQTLHVTLHAVDFTFAGESGTPKLILSPNAALTTWSLKPYLVLPGTVTIPPGQTVTVNYYIKIPAKLGAGSYYSAIIYQSGFGTTGNLGLSASGATLVFVQVPGTVNENLSLENFGAFFPDKSNEGGNYASFITTQPPKTMAFTVKNHGNVVEAPVGTVVIKKWGHAYKTIPSTNPNNLLTLIGQTRVYISCIQPQPALAGQQAGTTSALSCQSPTNLTPGHYSASLVAYYGQNGNPTKQIIGTTSFWYIPLWLIWIALGILLIIIYIIYRIYKRFTTGSKGNKGYRSVSHSKSRRLPFRKKK